MATRHSTRSRPSGRARSNFKSRPTPVVPAPQAAAKPARPVAQAAPKKKGKAAGPPDYDEILGRFAEALALVETGYAVLDEAQQDWGLQISRRCCPAVCTLDHGIKALAAVYSEVDVAFLKRS